MNVALVTGATGFTGRYMTAALCDAGFTVHGLVHDIEHALAVDHGVAFHSANLLDPAGLGDLVRTIRPSHIVHLAAIAFVAHGDAEAIYRTNIVGTRNLLEAAATLDSKPASILLASSANIYGNKVGGEIDESASPDPVNDYAVSKLAMEHLTGIYGERLPIIVARPFNYTGVGQSTSFIIPKIVDHARRNAESIELGNLDVARDFSDVRMVVDAYARLLDCPDAIGETLNICSGRSHALQDVLDRVERISGHRMIVRVNPAFVRENEVKSLCGSKARLERLVGPSKDYRLDETLRWMLES